MSLEIVIPVVEVLVGVVLEVVLAVVDVLVAVVLEIAVEDFTMVDDTAVEEQMTSRTSNLQ